MKKSYIANKKKTESTCADCGATCHGPITIRIEGRIVCADCWNIYANKQNASNR